jgi:hypothetical protein
VTTSNMFEGDPLREASEVAESAMERSRAVAEAARSAMKRSTAVAEAAQSAMGLANEAGAEAQQAMQAAGLKAQPLASTHGRSREPEPRGLAVAATRSLTRSGYDTHLRVGTLR